MIAVIRIRGIVKVNPRIARTMELLRLNQVNHCVLVKNEKQVVKMVKKAESFITWGEIKENVLEKLLKKRGRISAKKRLTVDWLKEKNFKDFNEMAKSLMEEKSSLKELEVKPVFRLSPPSKGFERKGIKKPFKLGGVLGDRKEKINDLLLKMI
ncbi:MAG: 50S ribosomal protein L30 [archaeon]